METFFDRINYSACNEDSESERLALKIGPQDTVLCITGSGARALDLLVDKPAKLFSVDFNPSQNHLLELKIAAYKKLCYRDFKRFLGLEPCNTRLEIYHLLRPLLPAESIAWWDIHPVLIRTGVLYVGTWESLLRNISKAAFLRRSVIRRLMESKDLDEQRTIWKKEWDNGFWRFFLRILSNRFLWTRIIREPGASLIPEDFSVYRYMYERLNHFGTQLVLRENHFAHLLFFGEYRETCLLPIHLREENYETIRCRVDTIVPVNASLADLLDKEEIRLQISAYSLSDFSSYASPELYKVIWGKIVAKPTRPARFCERQFLVKRSPEQISPVISRNAALENRLTKSDLTSLYTFCAGEIESH
jgi:S-adenosylmethionine-diacylglycerol 3-amino-3-carboxypropyl transferase